MPNFPIDYRISIAIMLLLIPNHILFLSLYDPHTRTLSINGIDFLFKILVPPLLFLRSAVIMQ